MNETLLVTLACNDPGTGRLADEVTAACVYFPDGGMAELEGDLMDGDDFAIEGADGDAVMVGVGSKWFFAESHSRWVGNWCWDGFVMMPGDVAQLLNHLRTMPHWNMTAAHSDLYQKWERREAFTAADFVIPAPSPETYRDEWTGPVPVGFKVRPQTPEAR